MVAKGLIFFFRGMGPHIVKAGGFGFVSSSEEMENLMEDVNNEWENTEDAAWDFYVIVAKKSVDG
jgi:hypothetical protein